MTAMIGAFALLATACGGDDSGGAATEGADAPPEG
jgi:hypothetical protein